MSRPPFNAPLPLCQLPAGALGRVCGLVGDVEFCQRVREMGLGEATFVTKLSGTGPFVCEVNGNRIALSHGAAMLIHVEQIARR